MHTDQRTGTRSIAPARETFAAVALLGMGIGTVLRCLADRPGGIVGVIFTVMALAFLSRFRVSWTRQGVEYQTPVGARLILWSDISSYSVEPVTRSGRILRLRLRTRAGDLSIPLVAYSVQDIRILTSAIGTEVPVEEAAATLVS